MKQFWSLMKLELSQWKMFFSTASAKNKSSRGVSRALLAVMLVLIVGGYLVFFEVKAIQVLLMIGSPELLLKLIVTVSFLLTLVFSLLQLISSLYFSRDILILSGLPVKGTKIYASRLCAQLLSEIGISFVFLMSCSVVYMVHTEFSAALLLRTLALSVLTPILPVCFSALLAGLLTKVPGFWRHREFITTAFSVVFLLVYLVVIFLFNSRISADSEVLNLQIQSVTKQIDGYTSSVLPIRWHADALAVGGISLLWALLTDAAALSLIIALFGRNYVSTACRGLEIPTGTVKVNLADESFRGRSPFFALFRREILEMLRTPTYLLNGLLMSLLMPTFFIGILVFSSSSSSAGGLSAMFAELDPSGRCRIVIAGALMAVMGLILGMNLCGSTAISREGRRHPLFLTFPVEPRVIIRSKLFMALFFQAIGLLPACILIAVLLPEIRGFAPLMFLWGLALCLMGTAEGLTFDLKKPRLDWTSERQAVKSGGNTLLALLLYYAVLGVIVGLCLLIFMVVNVPLTYFSVVFTALLLIFCVLSLLWLRRNVRFYTQYDD